MQKQIKVKQEGIGRTAETDYYELELSIGNKSVYASVWFSYDRDIGETDFGYEILDDSDELTDEEREAVEEFISDRNFKVDN